MSPERADVRFSYAALGSLLRPDLMVWSNTDLCSWAKETGYTSAEFHPMRRQTLEILGMDSIQIHTDLEMLKSGHARFNPYATTWDVLVRNTDKQRPDRPYDWYNLGFAEPSQSTRVLEKLQKNIPPFPVIGYPYNRMDRNSMNPIFIQTHPAIFNDATTADGYVALYREGKIDGVVWDTYHALERTNHGMQPFGNLKTWHRSFMTLLDVGAIKEVHIQVGRSVDPDPEIPSEQWLLDMTGEYPRYSNIIGTIIRETKASNPSIPFVLETTIDGIIHAGLIKPKPLLPPTIESIQNIHKELVDFVRRV
jgi:hypothetical protein